MTLEHRACPAFSQADLSNFGRSECDVGHCRRCARIVSRKQRIANRLKSLPPCKVRELLAADHISRGVNMSGSGLEKLVHFDAALRVVHICRFQAKVSNQGRTPSCNE